MAESAINQVFLNRLRLLSITEGVSTLLLFFVAMPLKYLAEMPSAVSVVGAIHGGLFVVLVVLFLVGIKVVPLGGKLALVGVLAAIVPLGPFFFEARLRRLGAESGSSAP